jgi:recombination protein RecA
MYGQGISKWGELIDLAIQMDVIQKSGSWFSMGEERIGQGKESVKAFLMANPDIAEKVEAEVRGNLLQISAREPAKPAISPVAISADDFDDEN